MTPTAPPPLPAHSPGPLTPTFPDVFPWLMEHSWMHKAPTPCKSWGLCRQLHKWRQEASPGVRYAHPQPKRWAQTAKEVRDSTWHLKQLAPHTDWYSGCYKINCIFPRTKLEITQKAINAEICLCSAKISDKKPIRQFLPSVFKWIFFFLADPCWMQWTRSAHDLERDPSLWGAEWILLGHSHTSNHLLNMSPMGVHSRHALVKVHEEIMDKKKKKNRS